MIKMNNTPRCERCYEETYTTIMSRLNQQTLCMKCAEKEKDHPNYKKAVEEERREVLKGNYNHTMGYY